MTEQTTTNGNREPLVAPDRRQAIIDFFAALSLLEAESGLSLQVDPHDPLSRDMTIVDVRRTVPLPEDYVFDAWIDADGQLHIQEWIDLPNPEDLGIVEQFLEDQLALRWHSIDEETDYIPDAERAVAAFNRIRKMVKA